MSKMDKVRRDTKALSHAGIGPEKLSEQVHSWIEPIGILASVSIPAGAALVSSGALHYHDYIQHLIEGNPEQVGTLCMAAVAGAIGAMGMNHRNSGKRNEELIISVQVAIAKLSDFMETQLEGIEGRARTEDLHEQQIKSLLDQINYLTGQLAHLKYQNNLMQRDIHKDDDVVAFDDHIAIKR